MSPVLLTSNAPPEAPSDAEDPLDPRYNPEEWLDLLPEVGTRFDEPAPVQLEVRGVTGQNPDLAFRARMPAFQSEFWSSHTVQKNTVAAKLREVGRADLAAKLENCHSEWTICHCLDCGKQRRFPNRCDLFICPECTPRLSHERQEAISWWCQEAHQPKFVTLTCKNIPDLTCEHLREFKRWFDRLRHRKFANNWLGGFYTIEITNRGKGWHLHLHALVEARWIDESELSRQWSDITGGLGEIVRVKDARPNDYLQRVKTYIVKPEDLASWTPDQILTYFSAFDGCRTFGVFGNLYGKRTEFRDWIKSLREAKPLCPCGSNHVRYLTEVEALMLDLRPGQPQATRPPPQHADPQPTLLDISQSQLQPR
jgi:hypothetical protein